jgi:hypothetical protein
VSAVGEVRKLPAADGNAPDISQSVLDDRLRPVNEGGVCSALGPAMMLLAHIARVVLIQSWDHCFKHPEDVIPDWNSVLFK